LGQAGGRYGEQRDFYNQKENGKNEGIQICAVSSNILPGKKAWLFFSVPILSPFNI
jgi:hypothetical protein